MATLNATIRPTNASAMNPVDGTAWGIDCTLSGFIIQSVDYTEDRSTDQTQDQKGRVVHELDYDKHYTCTVQVIGTGTLPAVGKEDFTFTDNTEVGGAKNWKVQSVTYNGSYNDKKKYTINLERWENYPANT